MSLSVVVPSPNCPLELYPQQATEPSSSIAHVWSSPAAIQTAVRPAPSEAVCVGVSLSVVVPSPSCPYELSPQQATEPSSRITQLWKFPEARVWLRGDSRVIHAGRVVDFRKLCPANCEALNGAMDASKPSTSGRAWAETASRDRASVPLPTEEVAVTVWVVVPAPAGVPEMVPVDASRERPEGRAGETDQVTAYPEESEKARRRSGPRGAGRRRGQRRRGTGRR